MGKLFSINRFFLFFCLIFLVEWIALQVVGYLRLSDMAKVDGERIFGWGWPSKNIKSTAKIYDTKILSRSNNDAVIKISAAQNIEKHMQQQPEIIASKGAAVLTYYRTNNQWFLGKVEFE